MWLNACLNPLQTQQKNPWKTQKKKSGYDEGGIAVGWRRWRFVDRNEMKGLYTLLQCSAAICKITSESPSDVLKYFWNWPVSPRLFLSFMTLSSGDGNNLFPLSFQKVFYECNFGVKWLCLNIYMYIYGLYKYELIKTRWTGLVVIPLKAFTNL